MAYVLVAIGALMAVAGLYVIGYGWIDARYEEYWHALSAGASLTAGGLITLALGFAVRALLQVKAALVAQPLAVSYPEAPVSASAAEMPDDLRAPTTFDKTEPTISAPDPHDAASEIEPPVESTVSSPVIARERHPLRPRPAPPQEHEPEPPAAMALADAEHIEETSPKSEPSSHQPVVPILAEGHDDRHGADHVEADHHDIGSTQLADGSAATPADDYKLATPSTSEHDLQEAEHVKAVQAPAPAALPKTNDWFDRALADIDEELPLHAPPSVRSPAAPAPLPIETPAEPALEPATGGPEPVLSEAHKEAPANAHSTAHNSAVIGRYEAEGTSYVMYADGSIEAQSSAGVYRFGSMAELKAFIET